jgi:ssDNA thymidine ADP-ribosyltransferase, DarT
LSSAPRNPKIYHIVHVDRLTSIISEDGLLCDSKMVKRKSTGTTIGMNGIKERRLQLELPSHPGLHVGDCVPFYFCPRSVMLYLIYQGNHPELTYLGGQEPIIHLEADLRETVAWAGKNDFRWAFTLSNAGAYYFEDRCDLSKLGDINWKAVQATDWQKHKEGKQAEFLMESQFPWKLVTHIGVRSQQVYSKVTQVLKATSHKPHVEIKPDWYY